ncbi:NAD(P)H-binding protein [Streptomyces axinellae]|uniref:NAD(P)H-binding protein n=1 Tax=Streptomyces axinellae TaxID=552788 RepID=A0ABP6CQW3_9ACTN
MLGATGQIGRAAVRSLARDGWEVTAASRTGGGDESWPGDVRTAALDRNEEGALAAEVGDGFELLLDVTAMTRAHSSQLAGLADRVGSAVVLSSAAVYVDERGRGFGTQSEPDGYPRYPVPVTESQPTVEPDDRPGARKVLLEQELLALGTRMPVTVLRPAAVWGPHCRTPRELYFVKRWLDGRRVRVLAHRGESRFHPAHVENIAELVRLAARQPGSRILNAADPEPPTVSAMAEALDAVLGWECETVLLEGSPPQGEPTVGRTPWSLPHPMVLDMSAAERELGYRAVITYEEALPETATWLAGRTRGRDWREAFPEMAAAYDPMGDLFDYGAEDRWLAGRGA